jgi:hypothetical protein
MKSKWVNSKEVLADDDWVYPPFTPTLKETRLIQGHVAEIGVRTLFDNFAYQFGGTAFHQQHGGPIGARVTMCAARMVMQHWARGYSGILIKAGLRLPLFGGYVDDGRQGSTVLRKGMIFCEEQKEFIFSEDQKEIDDRQNEPDNVRMARICLPAMNSINSNLKFTTECPEDFPRCRLPTLDFVLWMRKGLLYHSYFEKEMRLQYTIMQRTAMSQQQKMAILGNELGRRLKTIHRDVLKDEMEDVVEHYIDQLKNSGYSRKEAKEVVTCGIVGWRRHLERREKRGQGQYLGAEETLEARERKKLLEKTNWYKPDTRRKEEDEASQFKYKPAGCRKKARKGRNPNHEGEAVKSNIKGVMFIPYTKHSELATRLRENEKGMERMTGYRIKIVEKAGQKLVDILHKANPWAGTDCNREGCLLCKTKRDEGLVNSQDCKKRNCVYETECLTCRDRGFKIIEEKYGHEGKEKLEDRKRKASRFLYIGETNRSAFERGKEHVNDIEGCKTSSHMLRHLLTEHEEEEENWQSIRFGMRILKSTKSAFNRQIAESVIIQQKRKGNTILNAKAEYNRCALPRLAAKLGEKDLEKWREADRKEAAEEASVEEKIRVRKKEKAKKRMEASRRMEPGQPKRKKQRIESGGGREAPGTRTGGGGEVPPVGGLMPRGTPTHPAKQPKKGLTTTSTLKKRKDTQTEIHQKTKMKRSNTDMKRYITCKRWRMEAKEGLEEDQEEGNQPAKDTAPPPVTVNLTEIAKSMIETLNTRWKDERNKLERERVLRRIECWTNQDLQVHMLGWLCTKSDEQIKEESIEMVGALEKVAYTSTITKKGETIMTDMVEICTMISKKADTILQPISPPQESSEAFARIGLVPTEEVSPKKLKIGESQQPGPAVEPLLGGGGEGGDG